MAEKNYAAFLIMGVLAASILSLSGRDALSEVHEHHHSSEGQGKSSTAQVSPNAVVVLKTTPEKLRSLAPADLVFSIRDSRGNPSQGLSITHERLLHTIIVSGDFSVFAHVHPEDAGPITQEMRENARFPVHYTFPKGGKYLVAVDSAIGGQPFSRSFLAQVEGAPGMGTFNKDLSGEKIFGEYRVTLSLSPNQAAAGKEATLRYSFTRDGKPVQDLEPYLAAPMHIAIVKADLSGFIHAHGEIPGMASMKGHSGHAHMVPADFGPDIEAHVVFPEKGLYKIFSEVKHQGKVFVTDFMVEVK